MQSVPNCSNQGSFQKSTDRQEIANIQFDISVLKTCVSKVVDGDQHSSKTDGEDNAVLRAIIEAGDRQIQELEAECTIECKSWAELFESLFQHIPYSLEMELNMSR
jgi:hypothetical protein